MAKFHGIIGYGETVEKSPGVYGDLITERECFGETIRNSKRYQSVDKVNDNINISNEISIIADTYARNYFHLMRYIKFDGSDSKWKIESVEIQYPRFILNVGGVYNEQ